MVSLVGEQIDANKKICIELKVKGTVQGVGFRPFVYRLASEHNIKGFVRNESDGVLLHVEGLVENVDRFYKLLTQSPPPLSKISSINHCHVALGDYDTFFIDLSKNTPNAVAALPPDIATCKQCLDEITNPIDRHSGYPFTNCTNCGPRFTIVDALPYDRINTSMSYFSTCKQCELEYNDPGDRRFHAQPVACPACGPQVTIYDKYGKPVSAQNDWLGFFWSQMSAGRIFAVKGMGGYHLACLAEEAPISDIRKKKNRPSKPFALMARDLATASKYCLISEQEAEWLTSPAAPVILLPELCECRLPDIINPGLKSIGIMLPYTPLHHLLMQGPFDIIVLTSANSNGLPMIKDDDEAIEELGDVADFIITHNRSILQRCDDSVARVLDGCLHMHRRSRGFTPNSLAIGFNSEKVVLGAGSEIKNSFCLITGKEAVLSQHIGDLSTLETEKAYIDALNHFKRLLALKIDIIAFDQHPQYSISAIARGIEAERHYGVYHHHAHLVSCLTENEYSDKAIGVILDGTGYGTDGAIWGFELLYGDSLGFTREAHQKYTLMPGGESAIRWPWRMALGYLHNSMPANGLALGQELFGHFFGREFNMVSRQLEAGYQAIPTSSCGRLFDAVSALLGVCYENTYDGQAAIELSEMLNTHDLSLPLDPYPYAINGGQIDFSPLFPELLNDKNKGIGEVLIARRFHDTIIEAIINAVQLVAKKTGNSTVALSGGTWLNPYLYQKTKLLLLKQGFKVLFHKKVPANDGGLSLGQAAIAHWRWKKDVPGDTDAG